jgi:hypothetical protein
MTSLLGKLRNLISHPSKDNGFSPTVEAAVDEILSDLSEYNRTKIANMDDNRLKVFHQSYGIMLRNKFRIWINTPLQKSCCEVSGLAKVDPDQASFIILKELQNRIRQADEVKD